MSQVIMARSPYLEAKVNRWCKEKKELVIDDCDPNTFTIIVDYMYGVAIPESLAISASSLNDFKDADTMVSFCIDKLERVGKLLQMSDKLLIADLKRDVEEMLIKMLNGFDKSGVLYGGMMILLAQMAEDYDCEKLLLAVARRWCTHDIMKRMLKDQNDDWFKTKPQLMAALLKAFAELP